MPYAKKRADLLERSLQGRPCTDGEVASLVATAGQIPALTSAALTPRADFVSGLGLALRAEAMTLPTRQPHRAPSASSAPRPAGGPMVLVIGKSLRILAGVTASLLLIGAVIGLSSRSALPGGLLYPVKQVLNSAAVKLAGSDLDRGVTLMSQAEADIGDARSLVERDRLLADPASVNQALAGASSAAKAGQQALLGDFSRTRDPQDLIAVQDFASRALPQLVALRPQVPAGSTAQVDALIALVHGSRATLVAMITACGPPCTSPGLAGVHSPPASAQPTAPSLQLPSGGLRLPTNGQQEVSRAPAISGAAVVSGHPSAPPPTKIGPIVPPVTIGHITSKAPVVVPTPPAVLPPARTPALTSPPTGVPGLP